jgi:hypothetical protein
VTYDPPAPSLSPDPAEDPANQNLLRSYSVSVDDSAGTVTVAGTFNGAPQSAQNRVPDLTLGCADRWLSINVQPHDSGSPPGVAVARLQGFDGRVVAPARVSGNSVVFMFSHPEFRGQGFECFRDRTFGGRRHYFSGYSPQEKASREPTYMTTGPFRYSDELFLRVRPVRKGFGVREGASRGADEERPVGLRQVQGPVAAEPDQALRRGVRVHARADHVALGLPHDASPERLLTSRRPGDRAATTIHRRHVDYPFTPP